MKIFNVILMCITIASSGYTQSIKGKVSVDKGKEKYLPNTVVIIEYANGNFKIPSKNPVMNQKDLKFIPFVLPVVTGTTVDFLNSDNVLHNVFSPDKCCNNFNLGTWPKNEKRSYTYIESGCESVILCNVHPEMEGYVLVLQNPYFTVADKDGNYEIKNVPVGVYTLKLWNLKLKAEPVKIKVTSSGATQNFKLTR